VRRNPGFTQTAPREFRSSAGPGEPHVRSYFAVGRLTWYGNDGGPFTVRDSPSARQAGMAGTVINFVPRWHAAAPLWLLAAALAFLPAIRLLLRLRRKPGGAGLCRACNYDLTGNVSGVCPECGTAVTA
jgi:hypothetical protein